MSGYSCSGETGACKMTRPTLPTIWIDLAKQLALRSTCTRKQVGTVITTMEYDRVLSIGYNGNAKGFPNECDSKEEGNCGCLHSEINALIKVGTHEKKTVFVTMSPCKACAKAMINANVQEVFFSEFYRDVTGVNILTSAGINVYWIQDSGSITKVSGNVIKDWGPCNTK